MLHVAKWHLSVSFMIIFLWNADNNDRWLISIIFVLARCKQWKETRLCFCLESNQWSRPKRKHTRLWLSSMITSIFVSIHLKEHAKRKQIGSESIQRGANTIQWTISKRTDQTNEPSQEGMNTVCEWSGEWISDFIRHRSLSLMLHVAVSSVEERNTWICVSETTEHTHTIKTETVETAWHCGVGGWLHVRVLTLFAYFFENHRNNILFEISKFIKFWKNAHSKSLTRSLLVAYDVLCDCLWRFSLETFISAENLYFWNFEFCNFEKLEKRYKSVSSLRHEPQRPPATFW